MDWIKKYKKCILIILFLCIIGIPVSIHCLFKIKTVTNFFVAEWSAGEFLSYCGTILSFSSTSILSLLALWQNEQIKKESDCHREQIERIEQRMNMPILMIKYENSLEYCQNISVSVENISKNIAVNVTCGEFLIIRESRKLWENENNYCLGMILPKSNTKMIFHNPCLDKNDMFSLSIQCYDIYENRIRYFYTGNYNSTSNSIVFNLVNIDYKI